MPHPFSTCAGITSEDVIDDDVGLKGRDENKAVKHQKRCRAKLEEGFEFQRRGEAREELMHVVKKCVLPRLLTHGIEREALAQEYCGKNSDRDDDRSNN